MTSQAEMEFASQINSPRIKGLNLSSLDRNDYLNLILQRSEILYDIPQGGKVIRAWSMGDAEPIERVVEDLGEELAQRAAAVILTEYLALSDLLRDLAPGRVADIGCGYGLFDLFLAQDLGVSLLLIDLESNDLRHFGFQQEGAAYSSLAKARKLLEDNGIPSDTIVTLNPNDEPPEDAGPVDLAVSFLSCGFHYPVDSYLPFLDRALPSGGAALFDLRAGNGEQFEKLKRFGPLETLVSPRKARRVLLRKK